MEDKSPAISPNLNTIPTEIYFLLFDYVTLKDVVACRRVCTWWRDIIDAYLSNNKVWERFCKRDYKNAYKQAMLKTTNITNWFEMYRSLSVWSQLPKARDSMREICVSDNIEEEIKNMAVQKHGTVMVHRRKGVFYYDLKSMRMAEKKSFKGQYKSILELEDIVIVLSLNSQLRLIKKAHQDWSCDINAGRPIEVWFRDVQTFLVGGRNLYMYTHNQGLFIYNFDNDTVAHRIVLKETIYDEMSVPLLGAWGYKNGCLYIISMSENMYVVYENGKVRLKYNLTSTSNLMDCMYQHNMLENMDWPQYYILQSDLKHQPHTGLLRSINAIKIHRGDIFFVATHAVVAILMYYKPFLNGQLNLGAFKPIREYNLSDQVITRHMQTMYLVVTNIDVIETKEGHMVLVSMQGKILVYTFKHMFERPLYESALAQ